MDVADVIGQSLQNEGLAEMSDDGQLVAVDTPSDDTGESSAESDSPPPQAAAAETTDTETETPEAQATAEQLDDLDRELEGLGLRRANKEGQLSRIRYSQVKRVWEKFKAGAESQHKKALDELNQKLSAHTQRVEYLSRIEQMLQDPSGEGARRYFTALAAANPVIRQILSQALFQAAETAPAKAVSTSETDPKPLPDQRFSDGSTGYSPEQFEKYEQWMVRQATRNAEAAIEKKYGEPIHRMQQREQMSEADRRAANSIRQNVETARQIYGQLFTDDFGDIGNIKESSKILAIIREGNAAGRPVDFLTACGRALVPMMQSSENAMRERIIKELNERPAAARKSSPAASAPAEPQTEGNTEALIAAQLAKHGMM